MEMVRKTATIWHCQKKPIVVWKGDLHRRFVHAVMALGPEDAVPKKILHHMNVPGLATEQISSHLQNHHESLKRELEYPAPNPPLPPFSWNQWILPLPNPQPSITVPQPPMGGYMVQGSLGNYAANAFNHAGPSQNGLPPMATDYAGDFLDSLSLSINTSGQGGLSMVNDHFGDFLMNNVQFDAGETSSGSSVNRPAPLDLVFHSPEQQLEEFLIPPTPFNHAFQGPDEQLEELLIPELPQIPEPHEIEENIVMEGRIAELQELIFQMDREIIQPAQDASLDGPSSIITDEL